VIVESAPQVDACAAGINPGAEIEANTRVEAIIVLNKFLSGFVSFICCTAHQASCAGALGSFLTLG
jgi:hypothetical protein